MRTGLSRNSSRENGNKAAREKAYCALPNAKRSFALANLSTGNV